MRKLILIAIGLAVVMALPIQADFFQCVATVNCFGSPNADVINGSAGADDVFASFGNDIVFGGDGRDVPLDGQEDDDIIFGGLQSDLLNGNDGNDWLIPGPDDAGGSQIAFGGDGNDTFLVFAGETVNCLQIFGDRDFDVLNLIGFGPYSAEFPFGQAAPIADNSRLFIQDPIAGGYVIVVLSSNELKTERINGLPSPNVTILNLADSNEFTNQNCAD